jgi:uncharacterized SAM-binding protein YcdF (DUF218 family)
VAADIYTLIKALVLPPGSLALLGLLGILVYQRWHRTGLSMMLGAALLAAVLGMPEVAVLLAAPVESEPPFALNQLAGRKVDAIVVLGGGAYEAVRESNFADEVSALTLERLRYGARLHRLTGLPLAVTGGKNGTLRTTEADLMATALETDFGVPVRWREDKSRNTAENALFTRERFGFETVVLVTHAVHMRRARRAFEDAGVAVIPAPMSFISRFEGRPGLIDFLPTSRAFSQSYYALYERLGAIWYRFHYQ